MLLNACNSAAQIDDLVDQAVPFAIGMTDSIHDTDAIVYAAPFYAAVADGQSILSAHRSAQADLALNGLPGADLPRLAGASNIDPAATKLIDWFIRARRSVGARSTFRARPFWAKGRTLAGPPSAARSEMYAAATRGSEQTG